MAENTLNLAKDAHLLSGKERARLIIKDAHEKTFGNKKGFLSETERDALMRLPDWNVRREYRQYCGMYEKTGVIMGVIMEAYLRFMYHYETLKKAHLLLNLSPAIDYLTEIVEENITDKKKQAEALKITDMIQALKISDDGKITLKHSLLYIKDTVPKAFEQACYFMSMQRIVEIINEELGFNVFVGKRFNETYKTYIDEVKACIKEHNDIMKKQNIAGVEAYLIEDPTYQTGVFNEWEKILFKTDED